jgi:hypothetical protein
MIGRVVDSLNQNEDGRDIIDLPLIGKMEDLARLPLLGDRDQFFTSLASSSPQFVEAWKRVAFMERRRGLLTGKKISCYVYLPGGLANGAYIRAFVKDLAQFNIPNSLGRNADHPKLDRS